jgi:hypothetical protein
MLIAALAGCSSLTASTNVRIIRTPPGDRAVTEEGASARLAHWQVGLASREGLKRGFFVAKSDVEWRGLWPNTDSDKVPIVPFDLDFSKEMLIVSSPAAPSATASEVKNVIVGDRDVHVYVTQTLLGEDCPRSAEITAKNYDLARTPRLDEKDVIFHVDTAFGEPCGKPPEGGITCKSDRSSIALATDLKVDPGTKVVCVASGLKADRPIFDLTWIWDALPIGSTAKIDVARGGRGISFVPDVIGTYRIALEVSDDLARTGKVTGEVVVPPPVGPLSLQLAWTKVDATDDPDTFPRVELRVYGLSKELLAATRARSGSTGDALAFVHPTVVWTAVKSCSLAVPLSWCTAKTAGATTIMTLDPSWAPQYAMAVRYQDERVPGQPVLCVRSFHEGKLAAERCDPDKRAADSWWEVGTIDSASGKTPETMVQEKLAAAHTAATADAGAAVPAAAGPGASAPDAASAPKPQ